jgi:hypothetical protein
MYSYIYRLRSATYFRASLLLLILSASATICAGQTEPQSDEEPVYVSLPDQKLKAVVDQILRATFTGVKGKKRIEIYDRGEGNGVSGNMDGTWFPKLPGVQLVFVTEAELNRRGGSGRRIDVYFFTKPKIKEGRYEIGFAQGDPFCTYSGGDWTFNMIGRVRVRRSNSGFGAGCCNGTGH